MGNLSNGLEGLKQNARITVRRDGEPDPEGKCIVYWMQRAQRGNDNHALNLAITIGNELKLPVVVYFAGISNFPHANLRHYVFLQQGLRDVAEALQGRNVSFVFRKAPHEAHDKLLKDVKAAMCVGDENWMREPESWRVKLAEKVRIPFWTVDTDTVVPAKLIEKAQYGAYTIRPRLYRALPEYLVPYENPKAHIAWEKPKGFQEDSLADDMTAGWKDLDRSVGGVTQFVGGSAAGLNRLKLFCSKILPDYDETRNHPEVDGTSAMSPYLHYGHVGPQTIALAVAEAAKNDKRLAKAKESYFNELIAWRELAINFVRFTTKYDTPDVAEDWARKTIAEHAKDEREHLYSLKQLEAGETYDELWNAAQVQMVETGWMHNYLRMYWAKKILEWTPDVTTAVNHTVYLNDKYFLDGRDPNGYAGIAWSMVGKFDRPWFDRPIFGKIRYMSGASTGRKFNSKGYIKQMMALRGTKLKQDG